MKGIVFVEFLEMVEQQFSADLADDLIDNSDLPSGGAYTAVGTYDHTEIVTLVLALSQESGIPVPDLIKAFGEYLFGRFFELYPSFFEGVSDCMDFLSRIEDVIHVEVKKLYPSAQLPKFDIDYPDRDHLVMVYHSDRHLGDLAEGLIQQSIKHFKEQITLERENLDEEGATVRFTLTRAA